VIDPRIVLNTARDRARRRIVELSDVFDGIVESSEAANLDDEHDPEGATVAFERTQVTALLDQARLQIAELDDAEDRLRRGVYGVCERCGQPIAVARLEVQPAARCCVGCAGR
jgi:DnaK suppressor protein